MKQDVLSLPNMGTGRHDSVSRRLSLPICQCHGFFVYTIIASLL